MSRFLVAFVGLTFITSLTAAPPRSQKVRLGIRLCHGSGGGETQRETVAGGVSVPALTGLPRVGRAGCSSAQNRRRGRRFRAGPADANHRGRSEYLRLRPRFDLGGLFHERRRPGLRPLRRPRRQGGRHQEFPARLAFRHGKSAGIPSPAQPGKTCSRRHRHLWKTIPPSARS